MDEITDYPFGDMVTFRITLLGAKRARLPLTFRIPSWCLAPEMFLNGENVSLATNKGTITLEREWKSGDEVVLHLPMHISFSRWASNSVAVERGPLVYALKIEEKWEKKELDLQMGKGAFMWEVSPKSPWNYAIVKKSMEKPKEYFQEQISSKVPQWPWSSENAPVSIRVKMTGVPSWKEYNGHAGPLPYTPVPSGLPYNLNNSSSSHLSDGKLYDVRLIPYGCTVLRITQFPVIESK
ncbi:MAG: glycoside hydrolase family 127 protein [Alistipes sp.]|nr:glycoside hydrolase family 127 protein [Candidatus Alistipes equi]